MNGDGKAAARLATNGGAALQGIDACVFDAYGTLFDISAATQRCRDALGEQADSLTELWRSKQLEYCWLRSLRGDYVDFWHITGQSLDYALATLGLHEPALRSRLMEMYFVLDAYPEVRETLAALRAAGVKTAILSNGSPSMLTAAVHRAVLEGFLDAVISVDPVRIYKPHPTVYQLAVDRLRIPAKKISFLSSNYWDASGAALFGFRVVWINRVGVMPDPLPGQPEREINSLSALPALLGVAAEADTMQ
jgi:2-haloacid dehalogenase